MPAPSNGTAYAKQVLEKPFAHKGGNEMRRVSSLHIGAVPWRVSVSPCDHVQGIATCPSDEVHASVFTPEAVEVLWGRERQPANA